MFSIKNIGRLINQNKRDFIFRMLIEMEYPCSQTEGDSAEDIKNIDVKSIRRSTQR